MKLEQRAIEAEGRSEAAERKLAGAEAAICGSQAPIAALQDSGPSHSARGGAVEVCTPPGGGGTPSQHREVVPDELAGIAIALDTR